MCRLYGFRSNAATKIECSLVKAQNALLAQSRSDERGLSNADGWGIASYEKGVPVIERRAQAAYEDLCFSQTAEAIYSDLVMAHVRRATMGEHALENCHPFSVGIWTFAHNGTLYGFAGLKEKMLEEIPEYLRGSRVGSTDSELIFLWLLGQIAASEDDLQRPADSPVAVSEVLARGITELTERGRSIGAELAKLNLLVTNGEVLWATRWGNSLFRLHREGVQDCEICGLCHIPDGKRDDYHAVVIASEPISSEAWEEVPDQSLVMIDSELNTSLRSLSS